MKTYSLTHLTDRDLLHGLTTLIARDRCTTAALLAHLAEVDTRRLYLPAAFPSMHEYCVHELHLSEESAYKRIRAARAARQFPALFAAVADGRLHLTAVVLLAPCLTAETVDDLIAAATHKSKPEIEQLIAERSPRLDVPTTIHALPVTECQLDPDPVSFTPAQLAPDPVAVSAPPAKVAPLSPQRFALSLTMGQSLHDKLRYAQALLSHQVPSGDVAEVLERALDALIPKLEKQKFAATDRPQRGERSSERARHIPAAVKRAVWKRDGGQCTFVSEDGQRCQARTFLEFDHVEEVARGGRATEAGIRLRCRAHNQYGAECTFGAEFMSDKRQEARTRAAEARRAAEEARARAAAEARARAAAEARERAAEARREATAACARAVEVRAQAREARAREAAARATEQARARAAAAATRAQEQEVGPWLRRLGLRADEVRRAAAWCVAIPDAPLEERVRVALSSFGARSTPHAMPPRRRPENRGAARWSPSLVGARAPAP